MSYFRVEIEGELDAANRSLKGTVQRASHLRPAYGSFDRKMTLTSLASVVAADDPGEATAMVREQLPDDGDGYVLTATKLPRSSAAASVS